MLVIRIGSGASCEVRAIASNRGVVPLFDFLQSLDRNQEGAGRKIMHLLRENVPAQGPPKRNRERCKHLGDGIYEFKTNQIRVLWFYDHDEGAVVVCTHGFLKKKQKTPPREIKRAVAFREQYEKARETASIVIRDLNEKEGHS